MSKKKTSRFQTSVILGSRAESVAGPMDQPAICLGRFGQSLIVFGSVSIAANP